LAEASLPLEAALAALGPAAVVATIASVRSRASCNGPRGPYSTLIESERGDRLRFSQHWPDGRAFEALIEGPAAWALDAERDEREPLTAEARAGIRSHEFQLLPLVLAERYSELTLTGPASFDGTACDGFDARDELGLACRLYFERASRLLSGLELTNYYVPEDRVTLHLGDWRPVAGVLFPWHAVATDRLGDWIFEFEEIVPTVQAGEAAPRR
jgi:hypothetical protein